MNSGKAGCFIPSEKVTILVRRIIKDAIGYQELTGKKLGITGEIGEYLASNLLNLKLCNSSIMEGFDAIDRTGKKVQIKTRRSEKHAKPKATSRLSAFSKHEFDYALLVILSDRYEVLGIWKADYKDIENKVIKNKRRTISVGAFKQIANQVHPKH